MPIYEYQCQACGEQFEKLFLSLSRVPAELHCPTCQSPDVRRLVSAPAPAAGSEGGGEAEAAEPAATKPAVFGRKELQAAQEKKAQLREQAAREARKTG
jgi:putative FmdB family regulatory protein